MKNTEKTMDKLVALCKGRGFIYPGSEIYGGLANTWDFGPLGVELKNNIKSAWRKKFIQECKYNVGLDSAILMNPQTWVASGHIGGFSDPLMDCKACKTRHRADNLIEDFDGTNCAGWSNEQMMDYIREKGITCPNCGKKLHFWNIKAECSACGVSIPNFDWEARLEEDNRNAEKAFGVFNRTLSRMAYSMWGTKLRIARLVLTFLPAVGFILPWSNIKGTGSSFVLSILAFDGSKSLIDFFKAFFGDVGLFTTTMGMEGYGGPVTLGVIGYFLFLLSALFIVIAFFMVLIRCKNSKTKTTIVFDVLSVMASVAAVICFTVGGQRGADLGAFSFGGNAALAPSGSIGWGYFVALLLLLVATGMNIAVVKAPAKSDEQLENERLARVAAKEEKERLAEEKRELERVQAAKKAQEEEKAKVEEAKRKLAAKAEKRKNKK